MKFEQFEAGLSVTAGPYIVTASEILGFAGAYDPQWFHIDPEAAKCGRWGGLIASGWQTCAVAMRLAYEAALINSESWGSPGLDYVKWPAPVRPGDALTFVGTVQSARRSTSKPWLGIVKWRWQLFNQNGAEVLDTTVNSYFDSPIST
ncbi:MaoC family dehydratase [Burkholderia seminalis]|uniref:MaoC family dehydratase n=1 Tax=Burkholderia seminalis TaxID=488731 RepID=A0A8A8DE89_9BURK|nr:MaoC family dehydratase [Burkholderia seminalis]QTO23433.1 MaoC family dehydratase [Burkholderia seminalis]